MMGPHDNRRLKAFIRDEKEAAEEYRKMGEMMLDAGHLEHATLFYDMAEDEAKHAETVEYIMKNKP
ncbi:MAG: hypothetical protein KAS66_13545 [Candidatus Omnitrophica bacterium]|nr:hypothetical protein [Candidatus Omnitrophota bacterium]